MRDFLFQPRSLLLADRRRHRAFDISDVPFVFSYALPPRLSISYQLCLASTLATPILMV